MICLLHNTWHQKLVTWNDKYFLSHTVSVVQEFESSLDGWFWLRVFHEVVVKMLAGAVIIWRFDWGWRLWFKVAHSHGWQGVAAWREPCCLLERVSFSIRKLQRTMAVGVPRWPEGRGVERCREPWSEWWWERKLVLEHSEASGNWVPNV